MKEYVKDQSTIGLHVKKWVACKEKMNYVKELNIKVMIFFLNIF